MAGDKPGWYYVGNGQLRHMDGDGWTEEYKPADRAGAAKSDPEPDPASCEVLEFVSHHLLGLQQRERVRFRWDTWREVLGPQLTIPVPLLAVGLWIPTGWSAHDPRLSLSQPRCWGQRIAIFDAI